MAALHGIPAVLVDRRHPRLEADFVSLDNPQAMRSVCDHLVDQGWQELLYLTQPLAGISSRLERAEAFRTCLQSHGPDVRGTVQELHSDENDALDQWLQQWRATANAGRPAAIVAGNSVVTLRVAAAMDRLGWTFPEDVGFVGVDDPEWAPLIRPGLSAVAQPTEAIGRCAAQCLIARLGGLQGAARELLLPGQLVIRGSSLRRSAIGAH